MPTTPDEPLVLGQDVRLLGWGLRAPEGTSYRLDQPCVQQHGSLGGWSDDGGDEVAFTMLWRPLRYWSRDREGGVPCDLDQDFVEQALAATRRDGHRVEVHERSAVRLDAPGHPATRLDLGIGVRRRLSSARLRRCQALWTCPVSRRHLAFEVSAMAGQEHLVHRWFAAILPTVTCHESSEEPERG